MGRAEDANRRFRPVTIGHGMVTRPAHPGSATVHSLLEHLRCKGVDTVPEPLDLDRGLETLRFVEGASGGDGWAQQHSTGAVASAARLLRTLHDAASDWTPPADAVWGAPPVPGDDVVFCHGDPGPWNFIWQDHQAIALIDWDFLHPAPRVDDVAYALRWFAPMRADAVALHWHHFPQVPDRKARVSAFLGAYGSLPEFDIVDAVTGRMQATIDHVTALAANGVEPQRSWVSDGLLDREASEIGWINSHRHLFA